MFLWVKIHKEVEELETIMYVRTRMHVQRFVFILNCKKCIFVFFSSKFSLLLTEFVFYDRSLSKRFESSLDNNV